MLRKMQKSLSSAKIMQGEENIVSLSPGRFVDDAPVLKGLEVYVFVLLSM